MGKPVVIKILGDASNFTKSIDVTSGALGRLGEHAKTASKGVVLATGAIAVGAGKAAVSFENDMAQVFTLLPGISGDAMGAMGDQVLDFSKQMGIVPSEVVPALYDALSAGVPQDNVFEFMETAGKAAIGGNLDVAASVDLLSTATNAYAATGLEAAEASDIFFTTVRLGKTTVPELQSAFSQVGPVAAALGVSLDEVGASMAVLTASGVPTAGAATQIRSAIAELGKSGTVAAKAFEDINGTTFPEFIEQGGTFEEALLSMSESGNSLIDMFGSIEAAQGVMALTANGGQALSNAIDQMGSAAGATEGAFGTMDETSARSMARIKANLSAVTIQLGNKLLPVFAQATDWIVANFPAIEAAVIPVLKSIRDWVSGKWPDVKEAFQTVVEWIVEHWPQISEALMTFRDFLVDDVMPVVTKALGYIGKAAGWLVDWFIKNWPEIKEVIATVRDFLVDDAFPAISDAIEWVREKAEVVFNWLRDFWEEWGDKITSFFKATWDTIKQYYGGVLDIIMGLWKSFKAILDGDWSDFWEGIKQVFKGAWGALSAIFTTAWATLKLVMVALWEGLKAVVSAAADAMVDFVVAIPGKIVDGITSAASDLITIGGDIMRWIGEGIKSVALTIGDTIWDALPDPVKWALEHGGNVLGDIGGILGLGGGDSGSSQEDDLLAHIVNLSKGLTDDDSSGSGPIPRVHGGPASSGNYIVGERGPEILSIPNSLGGASVIANADMPIGSTGGITINVAGTNASAQDIGDELMWQLRRLG